MMHVHFYIRLLADVLLYDDVVFTNEEIRALSHRVRCLFLTHFLALDMDFRKLYCEAAYTNGNNVISEPMESRGSGELFYKAGKILPYLVHVIDSDIKLIYVSTYMF